MNDSDRRRLDTQRVVSQFFIDNAADFPAGVVKMKAPIFQANLSFVETQLALQQSAAESQAFEGKDTVREDLRDLCSEISKTARSMQYDFDGIEELFRFNRGLPDEDLLARARAFHADSAQYEADFIAYEMPADFRAQLNSLADAFEAAMGELASAKAEQIGATAEISSRLRDNMRIIRTVDQPIRNKYADNPGKLAAWASASHVEKPPKPKAPPAPPEP